MYPNQLPGFSPANGMSPFTPIAVPGVAESQQSAARYLPRVQINDIYQVARQRAVEDHQLDRLFNADFYGDAI